MRRDLAVHVSLGEGPELLSQPALVLRRRQRGGRRSGGSKSRHVMTNSGQKLTEEEVDGPGHTATAAWPAAEGWVEASSTSA